MISKKIKEIMKEKHVTNVKLAKYLGLSPQSLTNKFYRGSISIPELIVILDYLGCELAIITKPDTMVMLSLDDAKSGK